MNTNVLAINPASIESHQKYADSFKFNFTLVSDVDKKICSDYKVLEKDRVIRTVYIIDPDGVIIYAKKGMPLNQELLEAIKHHSSYRFIKRKIKED